MPNQIFRDGPLMVIKRTLTTKKLILLSFSSFSKSRFDKKFWDYVRKSKKTISTNNLCLISIVQNSIPFNYCIDVIYQCFSFGNMVIVFNLQLKRIYLFRCVHETCYVP